jgi:hypothetical protein
MALWGKADKIFSPGTISVDYSTLEVTGAGTSFTAASAGDVISVGAGYTFGEAVILEVISDTLITIATDRFLSGEVIGGEEYVLSQKPKYTMYDSHYAADEIYGVDVAEADVAKTTQYSVEHAGWVGVQTYIDMHGELRVKTETLVAMSEITSGEVTYGQFGDADDDNIFPDAVITITSQPESVGIGTTEDAVFVVEANVVPEGSVLTYQWEENGDPLVEGGDYEGVDTSILTVSNDDDKDGNEYQVVITTGDTSVTSDVATITYN